MSGYFEQFPFVAWGSYRVRNITARVIADARRVARDTLFDAYRVTDSDRPDTIAAERYGSPDKDWVVLAVNGIGPDGWPMTERELDAYLTRKYGLEGRGRVSHYVDGYGRIVQKIYARRFTDDLTGEPVQYYDDGQSYGALRGDLLVGTTLSPVTYEQLEVEANDARREIRLLRPEYVGRFVADFAQLMSRG